jgi:D-glycero-alpha-D-manno-heptose-7-phosphate kinase
MIVTKTPLRVSLFGGGTDLPEYYEHMPGTVLSATIDVNMFININESPKQRIKACYDEIEIVDTTAYLNHERIRETLLHFDVHNNLEIASFCHIPTKGTGLGSSSSYTVGLSKALCEYKQQYQTKYELAETAYFIERERCNERLGKQDQYAASFGGINMFQFYSNETLVTPVDISYDRIQKLQDSLMYFYTGITRVANNILEKQAESSLKNESVKQNLKLMADSALDGAKILKKSSRLDDLGGLLDYNWSLKRQLTPGISNSTIDDYYIRAVRAGAIGGKLLGAGGGGFLMFYVPPSKQNAVRESLKDLKEYKFKFSFSGSEVVLNAN